MRLLKAPAGIALASPTNEKGRERARARSLARSLATSLKRIGICSGNRSLPLDICWLELSALRWITRLMLLFMHRAIANNKLRARSFVPRHATPPRNNSYQISNCIRSCIMAQLIQLEHYYNCARDSNRKRTTIHERLSKYHWSRFVHAGVRGQRAFIFHCHR